MARLPYMLRYLLFLCTSALYAQTVGITLDGTIYDATGAVIAGVDVRAGESRARSDENGFFVLHGLQPGMIEVRASHTGFNTAAVKTEVPRGGLRGLRIVLSAGMVTEQLQVSASADMLQTTRATQGVSLGSRELQSLPTASRNVTHLIVAEAGVSAPLPDRTGRGMNTVSYTHLTLPTNREV